MKPTILLTTALAVLTVLLLAAWSFHEPASSSHFNKITRDGTITGWALLVDGTVVIRLEGRHNNRDFKLWFATPPTRSATRRYEELVLEAVMALRVKPDPATVTVISDTSNNESGARVEDALPLRSLRQQ